MGSIHGDHLEGTIENARPGLDVDQCVVHDATTGLSCDVAAEVDRLMDNVSVTNVVPGRWWCWSILPNGWRTGNKARGEHDGGDNQSNAPEIQQERYRRNCARHAWPSLT